MATISVSDVLGVPAVTLGVEAIAAILSDNQAGVLAELGGVNANANVATMALLPNDAAVAAAGDEVRYLTSRPAALVDVLIDHFSTGTNLIADVSSTTDMADGNFVSAGGVTWVVASKDLTFDSTKTLKTVAAVNLNSLAGSVGVYDETSDFLLQESRMDDDLLKNVNVTLGQVLLGEGGSDATSYADVKFETVKKLILAHGVDIFKATEEIDGHWLTVFLPNEAAFVDVETGNPGRTNLLTWCKDLTQAVLKNHVLNDTVGIYSEDISDPAVAVTLSTGPDNQGPTVTFGTDSVDVNADVDFTFDSIDNTAAKVLGGTGVANLYTSNAISHEIDTVLALTAELALVDAAIDLVNLTDTVPVNSTLLDLVTIADALILEAINGGADKSEKTLLIPSEDAFAALTADQLAYLQSAAGLDDLNMILKAHLFDKPYFTSTAAPAGMTDANMETPSCSGSVCSSANLSNVTYSKFGLSYIIDAVIVPSGAKLAPATPTPTETDSDSNSAASTTAVSAFAAAVCAFGLSFLI